ncbi:hypothetical protein Tco_1401890 [Tanacetum coccineum]
MILARVLSGFAGQKVWDDIQVVPGFLLGQERRLLVNTSLIHKESHKSPTAVLFDVDTGRISIRHCKILKSITLNVLARSDDNA